MESKLRATEDRVEGKIASILDEMVEFGEEFDAQDVANALNESKCDKTDALDDILKEANLLDAQDMRAEALVKFLKYHTLLMALDDDAIGYDSESSAKMFRAMGTAYHDKGNLDLSLNNFEKSLRIYQSLLPNEHDHGAQVADVYCGMSNTYNSMHEEEKAFVFHRKALDIRLAKLGSNHNDVALSYGGLGCTYFYQSKWREAREHLDKGISIRASKAGAATDTKLADLYGVRGAVLTSEGNDTEALVYYSKAIDIFERKHGENHPKASQTYNNMATSQSHLSQFKKAEDLINR
jgi:tetratricopeptide (TPR) repeat protein